MQKETLKLEGVLSLEDADKILNALNEVWGVSEAEVSLNKKEAVITYDEKAASQQDFEQAIIDSGFGLSRS